MFIYIDAIICGHEYTIEGWKSLCDTPTLANSPFLCQFKMTC